MPSLAIAGATGLVGGECVRQALADPAFERVVALVRRPPGITHPKLDARVVDFDRLDAARDAVAVEAAVCALGTTIRQAGSQEAFRRVDHDYVLAFGRLAREAGVRHFLLVSASGADAHARIFYNRVKGEVERDLRALGFPSLTIVRPSLLLGERREFRLGEQLGKVVGWIVPGRLRPVRASAVAGVMLREAKGGRVGERIVESEEIR
jgi:uncharacterized protein YbjT (DUF2867 family)